MDWNNTFWVWKNDPLFPDCALIFAVSFRHFKNAFSDARWQRAVPPIMLPIRSIFWSIDSMTALYVREKTTAFTKPWVRCNALPQKQGQHLFPFSLKSNTACSARSYSWAFVSFSHLKAEVFSPDVLLSGSLFTAKGLTLLSCITSCFFTSPVPSIQFRCISMESIWSAFTDHIPFSAPCPAVPTTPAMPDTALLQSLNFCFRNLTDLFLPSTFLLPQIGATWRDFQQLP